MGDDPDQALDAIGSRLRALQLLPLARAHGVTLDELVDAPATGDPASICARLPATA
ncbi:MAG: hypothetical protein ACRDRL_15340 [Sciscionella sp.]